jgi:hypothetical protein
MARYYHASENHNHSAAHSDGLPRNCLVN